MSSIMNFSLEYWHLAALEAVVLVIVCALTFRKPECITLASGSTVERPRSRLGVIAVLVLMAVTWALHMTGFDITVIVRFYQGDGEAKAWGCDLTYDYVKINGDYRT